MKIFANIKRLFRGKSANEPAPVESVRQGGGSQLWQYAPASPAMCIATVYRCIKLLTESVANLPILYKRMDDRGVFREARGSRLWYLLNVQPSPDMSAFDFKARVVYDLIVNGNAYVVPFFSVETMDYSRLAIANPDCVTHDTVTDRYKISDIEAGIDGEFGESEIVHIVGMGHNPKHGLSVLQYARQTLEISKTANIVTLDQIANGGDVRGIVGNDRSVKGWGENQDEQLAFVAEDIDEKFSNGKKIVHMPGSVEFKQLSMSAADMQFIQTKGFTVREICRFFGVHPSFVFDDTSNNYKSAEMANVAFLSNTLNPILRKIENELLRKLCTPLQAAYRKFEFDRQGLYACDLDSRVKYMTQLVQGGFATINEIRSMEDREPVEDGDRVLVSANLKSLSELINQTTKDDEER